MRQLIAGAVLSALVLVSLASCRSQHSYVDIPAIAPEGLLRFEANVADARIYVDGYFAGSVASVARRGVPVQPGVRRIELRHEKFHSHYARVKVEKKKPVTVRARLLEVVE